MFAKKHPLRMCVICKSRLLQKNLYRFQTKKGNIVAFSKKGRSFYMCDVCLSGDQKKLSKIVSSKYKVTIEDMAKIGENLKEIAING